MGGRVVQSPFVHRQKSEEAEEDHHRVPVSNGASRCWATSATHLAFDVAVGPKKKEASEGGTGLIA
jgi:hypothetical protein